MSEGQNKAEDHIITPCVHFPLCNGNANLSFSRVTDVHFLSPAARAYPTKAKEYALQPVPSLKDWHELWAAWDTVTRAMTPEKELLSKPIELRNDLIFYLGHIPAFAGMLYRRA